MQGPAHLAGEHHLAVGGRFDFGAGRSGVVDAAVAGAVGGRWRSERIGDRRGDRRLIPAYGGGGGRGARNSNDEQDDDAERQDNKAHGVPPRFEQPRGGSASRTLQVGV